MKLRRLNALGIERFAAFLSHLKSDPTLDAPWWLLEDEDSSELVADTDIKPREFIDRLAVSTYLDELLAKTGLKDIDKDVGLWSWLTLFYFDQVCPRVKGASRKPLREDFRYIPATGSFQKYYRHLLYGPYVVHQAHREHLADAMCLLAGPVHITNDIIEQIASRIDLVSNPSVVAAATVLYIDSKSGGFKTGSKGSGKGSPRRFHKILDQFDLTYDLFGRTAEGIIQLLPKEFDRFKPNND